MRSDRLILPIASTALLFIVITAFSVYHAVHFGHNAIQYPVFLYLTLIGAWTSGAALARATSERRGSRLLRLLPADERAIIEPLLGRRSMLQSELVEASGFSAVKVSRILKRIEARGVVRRERSGYTNRVTLVLRSQRAQPNVNV